VLLLVVAVRVATLLALEARALLELEARAGIGTERALDERVRVRVRILDLVEDRVVAVTLMAGRPASAAAVAMGSRLLHDAGARRTCDRALRRRVLLDHAGAHRAV